MSHHTRFGAYFIGEQGRHRQACAYIVLTGPLRLSHTKYGSRDRLRPKIRCQHGLLKEAFVQVGQVPKSHALAQAFN